MTPRHAINRTLELLLVAFPWINPLEDVAVEEFPKTLGLRVSLLSNLEARVRVGDILTIGVVMDGVRASERKTDLSEAGIIGAVSDWSAGALEHPWMKESAFAMWEANQSFHLHGPRANAVDIVLGERFWTNPNRTAILKSDVNLGWAFFSSKMMIAALLADWVRPIQHGDRSAAHFSFLGGSLFSGKGPPQA